MEEVSHGVINPCTFFCLRKGIKCIVTETLTYLVFNSILSDWHLVKELKDVFSIACGDQSVLGPPFIIDQERAWSIPEQPEIYILWTVIRQAFKTVSWGFFLLGFFLVVCIWEPDHALKSQRSQENGKTPKIFVRSCRTLLGREVGGCSEVSPAELCHFGSGVCPCLCPHTWLCSHAGLLWPSAAFREGGYGLRKENACIVWVYCISGYGTENVQSFAKTANVLEEWDSPGPCWRMAFAVYKRYFKGCNGKTCPSKIFLEKMRGGCFQTRFEFIYRLSVACGVGFLPCPAAGRPPGMAVGSRGSLDQQRGLEWRVMEHLNMLATSCCPAGSPAQTELPSSCGRQVPFS